MGLPEQISLYMSLREPQTEALRVFDAISSQTDYKTASLDSVVAAATQHGKAGMKIEFDTKFPSFCFALATGVGKTRLMGACMYHLWKQKGYRNYFILAPGLTIYDKIRAELQPSHPKYIFNGLSGFPAPEVYDGDNYLRFSPTGLFEENQVRIFIFNISKIFVRGEHEFTFHKFQETLGDSFAAMLRQMDDLVILMDESHRYRGKSSLEAINHLKPTLGLEFTATPLKVQKNVIYSFGLAEAIGKFVKTPTVVTRTNLTTSDAQEIEKLKLLDGMTLHEKKKGRYAEYCSVSNRPLVKPFVLISTKDTTHASEVKTLIESYGFCEGRYKGKVIEIHSGKTGAESDENVAKLLSVESPTSDVEVVIHVNMLKEGWDVKNLCTIIPLRASVSEILTEQTIGRGLRLPFGELTGDADLDSLEIVSHDQYRRLIEEAKGSSLFRFKELSNDDLRPVKTVSVTHPFIQIEQALDRVQKLKGTIFASDLTDEQRLNEVVNDMAAEEAQRYQQQTRVALEPLAPEQPEAVQAPLFALPEQVEAKPFDAEKFKEEKKREIREYVRFKIDVPQIFIDTHSDKKLLPFQVKVSVGPFELVEQRILKHELSTNVEREGERVQVLEIEDPQKFLAGLLIDAVEELDVANDKATALKLVEDYLAQIQKSSQELKQIAHLYRDVILGDLKNQVESHIEDATEFQVMVKEGLVPFPTSCKTILAQNGTVPYTTAVPASDIRRYLFEGFLKSFYPQVSFDSVPEKHFAAVLEHDGMVLKWLRPPEGKLPINFRGHPYTPDFIVETPDKKYVVEVKARKELEPHLDAEVKQKALAAIRWCKEVSTIRGQKPWEYRLVPAEVVDPTHKLSLVLSMALKVQ